MKNPAIIFLFLLTFHSCWICPDPEYVEFDDSAKTITALSDDYFIESVTLTNYNQKDGYIELDTATSVTFKNSGQKESNKIDLTETTDFDFPENEPIRFQVRLRHKEGSNASDSLKEITFVSEEISGKKMKFGTAEPCP